MRIIHKVAAMVIENNSFLLVRKRDSDIWTSLGGHIEEGESEEGALVREIKEELDCDARLLKKLGDFEAKAAHDDAIVRLSTYLTELRGEPRISDKELEEFRFIGKGWKAAGIKLPDSIVNGVIPFCIKAGLLEW